MAVNNLNFGSQVDAWCHEAEARMVAVRNTATEDVTDLMREYTPIDLGFLAGTIQGSLNAPTPIDPSATNAKNAHIAKDASAGEISLTITSAKLTDTIYVCFTIGYAGFVEYGTSKMEPRAMVRRAAAQWPRLVESAVTRAKARVAQAGR
jgi:hypothetical protein